MAKKGLNFKVIAVAKERAPAYISIRADGASYLCTICGMRNEAEFIKIFAPDKKDEFGVQHKSCVDAHWLATAFYAGEL